MSHKERANKAKIHKDRGTEAKKPYKPYKPYKEKRK